MSRGWPVELADGRVGVRPIRLRDARAWREVRHRNRGWLRPWEATTPPGTGILQQPSFRHMIRHLRHEADRGRLLPFVVTFDGDLVGQITVAGITWGSMCSAQIGYWIDRAVAGRGIMPVAVALVVDHCFRVVGLHRIEVNIRPENTASRRVVEKLGLREEGRRLRLLHIDGGWRDHASYAITVEEVPDGLLARWHAARR
ncbi:MAG: GNAT family N-acetyltransferase [Streptomycetales bacterium]